MTVLILRPRRFSTGNEISLIFVESEAGKTPEQAGKLGRREKYLVVTGTRIPACLALSLVL